MRTCAVCGKVVVRADICNDCFYTWCVPVYPEWVRELCRLQKSFDYHSNIDDAYIDEEFVESL